MEDDLNQVLPGMFNPTVDIAIRRQIFNSNCTASMSDLERAQFIGLPDGCRIREGAKILCPENLKIGKNVWIGENAILDASGGLEIGSDTSIGLGVYIWTHDSSILNRLGSNTSSHSNKIKRKKVVIESGCFISGPSVVMPGSVIRKNSVIAPMSVVYQGTKPKEIFTPYRDLLELRERVAALEAELARRAHK